MPKTNRTAPKRAKGKGKPKAKSTGKLQKAPAAISRTMVTTAPTFTRKSNAIVIKHSEFFEPVGTPVGTAGTFYVDTFAINPGNTSVFPWLSTQAFGWERYRFRKLHFRYVPRVGTSQAGSLILSPDYDSDDSPPLNELIASSYMDATSCVPWQETVMRCNTEAMLGGMKSKYVRIGALKKNNDIKMYDACNLFVCRDSANSTAVTWGKLWVDYEIELITPHTIPPPSTSTYAGITLTGLEPDHPVTPESNGMIGGIVEKSGPYNITDNGSIVVSGANGWKISGLIPGARYFLQTLARSAGSAPWVYTTSPFTIDSGLAVINDIIGTYTHTLSSAGIVMTMNDVVVQATEAVAAIRVNWASATSLLDAAQLILSPVASDPAFLLL